MKIRYVIAVLALLFCSAVVDAQHVVGGPKCTVSSKSVVHKNVLIKADIFAVGLDEVKKLGISRELECNLTKSQAEELRKSLIEGGAKLLGSPVIGTIDNASAEISIAQDSISCRLFVLPKINPDHTITLAVKVSFEETNPERKQELMTQRRIAEGCSALVGGFECKPDQGREIFVLLTPKAVDADADPPVTFDPSG